MVVPLHMCKSLELWVLMHSHVIIDTGFADNSLDIFFVFEENPISPK